MYDDTKADEATITVIATGLHNASGAASKLQKRIEGRSSILSGGASSMTGNIHVQQPEAEYVPERPQFVPRQPQVQPQVNYGGAMPQTSRPVAPTPKVKEQSIKIPDFFKK